MSLLALALIKQKLPYLGQKFSHLPNKRFWNILYMKQHFSLSTGDILSSNPSTKTWTCWWRSLFWVPDFKVCTAAVLVRLGVISFCQSITKDQFDSIPLLLLRFRAKTLPQIKWKTKGLWVNTLKSFLIVCQLEQTWSGTGQVWDNLYDSTASRSWQETRP